MSGEDRIALVTGASRGIGRAIALDLANRGISVAVNYATNQTAAENLVEAISAAGGTARAYRFDVADVEQVKSGMKQIIQDFGQVDILVNNAGIIRDQPLVRMRDDDWRLVLSTDLDSAFYCSRAVVKSWAGKEAPNRRIVNIGSVAGDMGNAFQTNYCAAKGGLIGLTKALARELAPKKVTVNLVSPGCIETDGTSHLDQQSVLNLIPLGRFGTAEEVAYLVGVLVSPQAGYVTGQVFRVDGGLYM